MRPATGTIWLASASPRRRLLLEEAGIEVRVRPADLDDGRLCPGRACPESWAMALAYLKARRVAEMIGPAPGETILGADTVCVQGGAILGQPRDAGHARDMLLAFRDATHRVVTGVYLLDRDRAHRRLLFDTAVVRVGALADEQIDAYIASGAWKGKAGAYNLSERIDAGWPLQCEGDPATVMGLPMRRLRPLLLGEDDAVEGRCA